MGRYLSFLRLYVFIILWLCTTSVLYSTENKTENLTILLLSPRSGSNLLTCTLNSITRKPIGVFPSRTINSYGMNRLNLDSVCSTPFIYRTDSADTLKGVSSNLNNLILVSRNPKELLFRDHSISSLKDLQSKEIKSFINTYLQRFKMYESWNPDNRYIVFYEDFINQENEEIILDLLDFMGEEPTFFDDYVEHKEEYLYKILDSYRDQHKSKFGGKSSRNGPNTLYYTENKDPKLLQHIDQILQKKEPLIWEKYLKRFQS